ncbi:hypothetical protein GCM10009661_77860 [Catellatospora chokoriensis]|uniref:Uncharacterized protein n=1 Tax=Catellatospora chokoriensis TaxID=310353 RepID=A0A8J3K490_9ACTN|nr:hypothetical protein Cch02nite_34770 [Catellatospora chokoriensis]
MTIGLTALAFARSDEPLGEWWLGLVFFGLFFVAELTGLQFEVRRHGMILTLADVPFLLALAYLPPVTLLIVRLAVYSLAQWRRGTAPVKAAFNIALLGASTAFANLVVVEQGPIQFDDPRSWLVLVVAVLTSVVVAAAGVVGVRSRWSRAGSPRRRWRSPCCRAFWWPASTPPSGSPCC